MTDDATRDRISAIGRIAILTHASEEAADLYVEVTTADARALLDARIEVADKLRVVLAENQAMRDAITRLWKLELHAEGHAWMVANADLSRALHGHPVLDEIATDAVASALPAMLSSLPRKPDPMEAADSWSRAQADDDQRELEHVADLRAARDMLRRPDQLATGGLVTGQTYQVGYDVPCYTMGEPYAPGGPVGAGQPVVVHPDEHPLQQPMFPAANWLIWSHEHGAWWKPFERGYTGDLTEAGRYLHPRAYQICRDANAYGWVGGLPKEVMIEFTDDPQAAAAAVRKATDALVAERAAKETRDA